MQHHIRAKALALVFQPVMDWWVAGLAFLFIGFLSAAIPVVIASGLPILQIVVLVAGLIFTILYIADVSFFTYYALEERGLRVGSQLRHFFFSYRNMSEVRPCNITGLFSFRGKKRFALSGDCLVIGLRHEHWRAITLSPVQQEQFLNHLLARVDAERSSRATVSRSKK